MRKYFLLSAVALLTATTANATTDYAEVTAKATIEVANLVTCTNIDYGTIVVKKDNRATYGSIFDDGEGNISYGQDVISVSNSKPNSECSDVMTPQESSIKLTNGSGGELELEIWNEGDTTIYSSLFIPAKVSAGVYTGSFTATRTY
ncbi:MAG: hypothetical protein E7016_07735 [Alphaproteobacteria bacterium]|nr:hypothetical protein [Alphaproteobacteria bacterium]